jgi:L-amino acid N-acyltransferase YncA
MATIRLATTDDAAAIAAIYAPHVTDAATSFELEPPDAAEMARRIGALLAVAPWLVLTEADGDADADAVRGYAYASRHRDRAAYQWSVDVSVYVASGHARRGIGGALYRSLFALLRLQGFCAAHAGITLPNPASVGLHEALGFRPIGIYPAVGFKRGAWHDVGWWQLPLRERTGAPAAPLSLAEAAALPAWPAALQSGLAALR